MDDADIVYKLIDRIVKDFRDDEIEFDVYYPEKPFSRLREIIENRFNEQLRMNSQDRNKKHRIQSSIKDYNNSNFRLKKKK